MKKERKRRIINKKKRWKLKRKMRRKLKRKRGKLKRKRRNLVLDDGGHPRPDVVQHVTQLELPLGGGGVGGGNEVTK